MMQSKKLLIGVGAAAVLVLSTAVPAGASAHATRVGAAANLHRPQPPTGVTASYQGLGNESIAWVAPTDTGGGTISSYLAQAKSTSKVHNKWQYSTCTATTATSCTLTNLVTTVSYSVRVKAFNTLPKYSAPPSTAVTFSPSGPVAPIVLTDSSYGFAAEQGAVATDGTNVWVPLTSANSITEFNGATGALIRVLHDDTNLASPAAAVSDGHGNMWVLNQGVQDNSGGCSTCTASSVTEINGSTGAFEANYPIAACGNGADTVNCLGATSLAYVNGSLWVAIAYGYFGPGAIRQVNATRGTIGQTVVPSAGFGQNLQIAAAGSDFWVATGAGCNGNGGSVTQFDGTTGAELQVVGDCTYGMVNPGNIYSDGTSLYVVGENVDLSNPDSFTKINASTGALDYTSMTGIGYVMNNSFQSMAIDGSGNLWSVQLYGGIQLNKTSDGTINRTFGSGDVYGGGMVYAGGRIWQAGASTNTLTGWAA